MALPDGSPDLTSWAGWGTAAGAAIAWFWYFVKRSVGRSVIDPTTQAFLDGLKEDIERIEHALEGHGKDVRDQDRRINDLKVELAQVRRKNGNGR
jgi:hypothetical protein